MTEPATHAIHQPGRRPPPAFARYAALVAEALERGVHPFADALADAAAPAPGPGRAADRPPPGPTPDAPVPQPPSDPPALDPLLLDAAARRVARGLRPAPVARVAGGPHDEGGRTAPAAGPVAPGRLDRRC